MRLGIIGDGAIGRYVHDKSLEQGHEVAALLLRSSRLQHCLATHRSALLVDKVSELPGGIDCMIDCAGHSALQEYGSDILKGGMNLITVSLGALADAELYGQLEQAAASGGSMLHLASGAIGALDCLRAARVGTLQNVTYVGRKPPRGWKGSPAEEQLDLDNLSSAAAHFEGSARDAATRYPKNANVAAAVAMAGTGFDATQVKLIADPDIDENIHEIRATGEFGHFKFEIRGHALPDNPRSSALAAMSVISKLQQQTQRIIF